MLPDRHTLYKALSARDPRFDGIFFVGVTSTGIYCRPICPARTPKQANCRFFAAAPQAEHAGFRPCLRCRPELAPGLAPVDDAQRIAHAIVQRIEEGADDEAGLEAVARRFDLGSRQIRRIVRTQLGVSPLQLVLTRRLLLAKQLLTETRLPVTEIAFASGFASLRRFNDAFRRRYAMPPTRLRAAPRGDVDTAFGTSTLQLAFRPPYDWQGMLAFLKGRALKGVERVTDDSYARTVRLGEATGWIVVTRAKTKNALSVEFSHSLMPVLPALLGRLRALFDLDARPDVIRRHLGRDAVLGPLVRANPGLRVPGAFSGFEMGVRAILGQQVTVAAATTIAGRLAAAFGEPIATPFPELTHLSPQPSRLADASVDDIARHGIVTMRCNSIVALARAVVSGDLPLDRSGPDHETVIECLQALPGIGRWTANYIAMRALGWPDAFPTGDVAILNALGVGARDAERMAEAWRPWRSYAVLHLWRRPMPAGQPGPRRSVQRRQVTEDVVAAPRR